MAGLGAALRFGINVLDGDLMPIGRRVHCVRAKDPISVKHVQEDANPLQSTFHAPPISAAAMFQKPSGPMHKLADRRHGP